MSLVVGSDEHGARTEKGQSSSVGSDHAKTKITGDSHGLYFISSSARERVGVARALARVADRADAVIESTVSHYRGNHSGGTPGMFTGRTDAHTQVKFTKYKKTDKLLSVRSTTHPRS